MARESSCVFIASLDTTPPTNSIMTFDTHMYRKALL
jgi:hypothetical protein